jgi:hypothetical protein
MTVGRSGVLTIAAWVGFILGAGSCGRSGLDAAFGTAYATTGSAGSGGEATGQAGASGGASGGLSGSAGTPSLQPIPCGNGSCTAGTQICCVQQGRRNQTETCISAGAPCDSGASVGCISGGSCGAGQVCCESLLTPATMCVTAQACVVEPGLILCDVNADCPSTAPHCCQTDGPGVCAAQACPAGGGPQGPDGVGGPQD